MRFHRTVIFAAITAMLLVVGLACGGDDDSSDSDTPSSPSTSNASASDSVTTVITTANGTATPAARATEATATSSSSGSTLDRAEIDELVEAWLRALSDLGDVLGTLNNPLEAATAASKLQNLGADLQKFADLSTSMTAEDSAYVQEKYGDRIADVTKKFTEGLEGASSSPLGAALAESFSGLPMLGQ